MNQREKTARYLIRIAIMYEALQDPRGLAYRRAARSYLENSTKYIGTRINFVINQFEAGSTAFYQKVAQHVDFYRASHICEPSEFGWGTKSWDKLFGHIRKLNQLMEV